MRRVVSLFLPMWPTDRCRKNTGNAPPRDRPLVVATKIGPRRVIVAADKAAQGLGLRADLTVAHAQALVPELHFLEQYPLRPVHETIRELSSKLGFTFVDLLPALSGLKREQRREVT